MNNVGAYLAARWKPIVFWLAVILISVGISYTNRARQASLVAALDNPATRDATVRNLTADGTLIDVLSNTQDPNGDSQSAIASRSTTIRQNAALSVDKLVGSHQVPEAVLLRTLLTLHKDSDGTVQTDSINGLEAFAKLGDANLSHVVDSLKDGDPAIRSAAGTALKAIGGSQVADLTERLVKDTTAQSDAEDVLGNIGGVAVPYIDRHLSDPDLTFRLQMLGVLGKTSAPAAIPTLLQYAHGSAAERRVALNGLTTTVSATLINAKSATPPAYPATKPTAADVAEAMAAEPTLIGALESSTDESDIRSQAALTLGQIGTPATVAALIHALSDYDLQVADSARDALQTIGTPAVGALAGVARTGAGNAQVFAAKALGGIGTPQAVSVVASLVDNPKTSADERRVAVEGLGLSGSPNAVPVLVHELHDSDGVVADAASGALLSPDLEQPAVAPLVAEFTQATPAPFNASRTLSRMGTVAVRPLEDAARSSDTRTQTWAAVTLGLMETKDPAVVAALGPLCSSPNASVRFAATQALKHIQGA